MSKERIDEILVIKNLAPSKSKAQSLIMEGKVTVNSQKILKCGIRFETDGIDIHIEEPFPYVSRGALKLKKALEIFPLSIQDCIAIDIGSSTGGFTEILLLNGAEKVYAVDVGTNQLSYKLRSNPKVITMEQTNARYLEPSLFDPIPTIAVTDVSFISLSLILPVIKKLKCAHTIALIKPQFEVGRDIKNFDGVVKKDEDRQKAIEKVKQYAIDLGFEIGGITESPIEGPKGNKEFLIYLKLNY